ncbi:MAG: SMC-Scp complex subunit ScpB [Parcubacteria group bacterium]|nr:SMC-Scp complex subunit ScpB [Parcubacteria group bacterium]
MMPLQSKIESLLFVSSVPVSVSQLKKFTDAKKGEVAAALNGLAKEYGARKQSGMMLAVSGDRYQLVSHPDNATVVKAFLKSDITGELTGPALETLAIVAYRGPVTKPELEQIRGVNCGLILRNLLIRGLIERKESAGKLLLPRYVVTHEFIRFLGVSSVSKLPEYEKLSKHETLDEVLQSTEEE